MIKLKFSKYSKLIPRMGSKKCVPKDYEKQLSTNEETTQHNTNALYRPC